MADDLHLFHITCGGCPAGWAGEDRAHCGRCHATFDSIALYDAHRTRGSCVRPQALGLVPTKNGIWREPAPRRRRDGVTGTAAVPTRRLPPRTAARGAAGRRPPRPAPPGPAA